MTDFSRAGLVNDDLDGLCKKSGYRIDGIVDCISIVGADILLVKLCTGIRLLPVGPVEHRSLTWMLTNSYKY